MAKAVCVTLECVPLPPWIHGKVERPMHEEETKSQGEAARYLLACDAMDGEKSSTVGGGKPKPLKGLTGRLYASRC
jgi:hypothetical protein